MIAPHRYRLSLQCCDWPVDHTSPFWRHLRALSLATNILLFGPKDASDDPDLHVYILLDQIVASVFLEVDLF